MNLHYYTPSYKLERIAGCGRRYRWVTAYVQVLPGGIEASAVTRSEAQWQASKVGGKAKFHNGPVSARWAMFKESKTYEHEGGKGGDEQMVYFAETLGFTYERGTATDRSTGLLANNYLTGLGFKITYP